MSTAGAFAGRLSKVAINNAAVTTPESQDPSALTYTGDIEKTNSPKVAGSLDLAESSSSDSAGSKQFVPTWDSATLSFEFIADDNATQQLALWTAFLNKQYRGFRLRPRGTSATDYQIFMLGLVSAIEQSNDKGDVSKYAVTVTKFGAFVRSTQ